jgi:hypothetical protein
MISHEDQNVNAGNTMVGKRGTGTAGRKYQVAYVYFVKMRKHLFQYDSQRLNTVHRVGVQLVHLY